MIFLLISSASKCLNKLAGRVTQLFLFKNFVNINLQFDTDISCFNFLVLILVVQGGDVLECVTGTTGVCTECRFGKGANSNACHGNYLYYTFIQGR